jgi:thioredoxin-dependent peroxiredoxin
MRAIVCALSLALVGVACAADETKPPKEGDKAPNVTLPATQADKVPGAKDGKVSLEGLKGKNVVLFFYPKAMTPGCTVESCGFSAIAEKFTAADTVVIGISTDTLELQQKFTEKEKLTVPLLADADKSVTKAFGVLSDRGMANRYTFVIDKTGTVRKVYNKVAPKDHPEEVLKYVKENLSK